MNSRTEQAQQVKPVEMQDQENASRRRIIDLENVSVTYEAQRGEPYTAVENIDLSVQEREFVSLIGPSGCGKSTLLKVITGLLDPSGGRVTINGGSPDEARRQRLFGIVFQEPTLLPWRDVRGNAGLLVEFARAMGAEDPSGNSGGPEDLLRLVGLADFLHNYPRELSGGMKQRVAIARALSIDPAILMMDEPFGALDAMTRDSMNEELLRIWRQTQKTVVFITHSIRESVYLSDAVYVISGKPGRVVEKVPIELPRPRRPEQQTTPEFQRHLDRLRDLLESGAK
jgi:NitT/TauT family transport system ATP-binding protein